MSSFDSAEIARRMANLIRVGTVETVDYERALARVRFGSAVTALLPWLVERAGDDVTWFPPSVGEQVIVLSPCGETSQAVILMSLYQSQHPAPDSSAHVHKTVYSDGAVVSYDTEAKTLLADIPGDAVLKAKGKVSVDADDVVTATSASRVTIKAPLVELDANLIRLIGPVTSGGRGGEAFQMEINGPLHHINGDYTSPSGDVVASGVSLVNHTHDCSYSGSSGEPS